MLAPCHLPRNKRKSLDFVKTLLAFAFSQVGVILLCIFYAVIGANMFISMEVRCGAAWSNLLYLHVEAGGGAEVRGEAGDRPGPHEGHGLPHRELLVPHQD